MIGLNLGHGAVFQQAQSKVFNIIGLVMGEVVVLALCGIMLSGLIIQSSV